MNAESEHDDRAKECVEDRASLVRVLRHTALVASRLDKRDDAARLFDEARRASADDPSEAVQLELAFTCVAEERQQSKPG